MWYEFHYEQDPHMFYNRLTLFKFLAETWLVLDKCRESYFITPKLLFPFTIRDVETPLTSMIIHQFLNKVHLK